MIWRSSCFFFVAAENYLQIIKIKIKVFSNNDYVSDLNIWCWFLCFIIQKIIISRWIVMRSSFKLLINWYNICSFRFSTSESTAKYNISIGSQKYWKFRNEYQRLWIFEVTSMLCWKFKKKRKTEFVVRWKPSTNNQWVHHKVSAL